LALSLAVNVGLLAAYLGSKKRLNLTITSYEAQLSELKNLSSEGLPLTPTSAARVLGSNPVIDHSSNEGFNLSELEAGTPRRSFIRSASKD